MDTLPECIFFNVHHNWEWVISESLKKLFGSADEKSQSGKNSGPVIIECKRVRDLPSQQNMGIGRRTRPKYALFRVEIDNSSPVWATSNAFASLDAKDSLYRCLRQAGAEALMPKTELLDWNMTDKSAILLPSQPALLKAACGSGGFGLYFVQNAEDVFTVMQSHMKHAQQEENFIEKLHQQYDGVPQWSLQSLVPSVRIFGSLNKRCQIRAYAVVAGSNMFVYLDHEVRVPSWDTDLDVALQTKSEMLESSFPSSDPAFRETIETKLAVSLSIEDFEFDCCRGCTARPYNHGRVKSETNRLMLLELDDIAHTRDAITECVVNAMKALKPKILEGMSSVEEGAESVSQSSLNSLSSSSLHDESIACSKRVEMAIAGIDLMLCEVPSRCHDNHEDPTREGCSSFQNSGKIGHAKDLVPLIVELNNNPAMAGEKKMMSSLYRDHLVQFVAKLIRLGTSDGMDSEGFVQVW